MKPPFQKATHQQTKTYNSQLVLKTIYDHGRISRADVARHTRLTRTTVSSVVADLIEKGLMEEVGHGPSAGGKAPILLSVIDDARHLIGIDLANGEFRGAVVNLRGEIRHAIYRPLQGRQGENALEMVYELVNALMSAATRPLLGIGIGTPGLIDTTNGVVCQAVNLDWRDLPLRSILQARYNLPIYLANDSHVAALAEYIFGSGQNTTNLVVVKVGEGIGAGIVIGGQLFQGDGYGAGEIGHTTVVENGLRCPCGNLGCLETVASTRAILERARAVAQTEPGSALHQFVARPVDLTLEALGEAFQSGDEASQRIILEAGHYLGIAVSHLVNTLNIQHISILGSLTRFGSPFLEAVREEMLRRSLSALARETQVSYAGLGQDVVILGASALLLTHELGLGLIR